MAPQRTSNTTLKLLQRIAMNKHSMILQYQSIWIIRFFYFLAVLDLEKTRSLIYSCFHTHISSLCDTALLLYREIILPRLCFMNSHPRLSFSRPPPPPPPGLAGNSVRRRLAFLLVRKYKHPVQPDQAEHGSGQ